MNDLCIGLLVLLLLLSIIKAAAERYPGIMTQNKSNGRKRRQRRLNKSRPSNPAQTDLFGRVVYFVYALTDGPYVFYIGQTDNPGRRLSEHIASAKNPQYPVHRYIAQMRRQPGMRILYSSTNKEHVDNEERRLVRKHKRSGLTNVLLR